MKINNLGPTGINPYKKALNKLDNVSKTTANKADKVEISSAAKEMQQISQLDSARQKKVEELKQSVQNGTYQPNAKATASSLLNYFKI